MKWISKYNLETILVFLFECWLLVLLMFTMKLISKLIHKCVLWGYKKIYNVYRYCFYNSGIFIITPARQQTKPSAIIIGGQIIVMKVNFIVDTNFYYKLTKPSILYTERGNKITENIAFIKFNYLYRVYLAKY